MSARCTPPTSPAARGNGRLADLTALVGEAGGQRISMRRPVIWLGMMRT